MAQVNDGDWVEGEPKWWWKYVFPTKAQLWATLAVVRQDPSPEPWFQGFSGEVQEGLAMVHASAKSGDREISDRLKKEGIAKIGKAAAALQHVASHV